MQAAIQSLVERLSKCFDQEKNVIDMPSALDTLCRLEQETLTKETLEETRIGRLINELRKQNQKTNPDLAQKCRSLIKNWQKLTAIGGSSGPSSRSATPLSQPGCSPALRRLTPQFSLSHSKSTPLFVRIGHQPSPRLTNGELPSTDGRWLSESYAPSQQSSRDSSPAPDGIRLKIKLGSASTMTVVSPASAQRLRPDPEEAANRRKRKADEDLCNGSGGQKPPTKPPKLKTTAELVAEMTKSLPEDMSISLEGAVDRSTDDISRHRSRLDLASMDIAPEPQPPPKRPRVMKRERKPKKERPIVPSASQKDLNRTKSEMVARFLEDAKPEGSPDRETPDSGKAEAAQEEASCSGPPRDWYDILPPLDATPPATSTESRKELDSFEGCDKEWTGLRSRFRKRVRDREVLGLPFVDMGLPDFLEFNLPNRRHFLSDQNFLYRSADEKEPG